MAEKRKKHKKVKVYECKHFKSDTDDFSRWIHCRNRDLPWNQCICENVYARKLCPCFKRGALLGEFDRLPEINTDEWKEKFANEFRSAIKELEWEIEDKQETLDILKKRMEKYG
jgi:hypothetical protein